MRDATNRPFRRLAGQLYYQLPTLTASLTSRLSDRQDATFLIVWFLSLGFCSFCYIEINIRICFSIEWLFSRLFKMTNKKKSSVFFVCFCCCWFFLVFFLEGVGHWCDSAPGLVLIWSPVPTGSFSLIEKINPTLLSTEVTTSWMISKIKLKKGEMWAPEM